MEDIVSHSCARDTVSQQVHSLRTGDIDLPHNEDLGTCSEAVVGSGHFLTLSTLPVILDLKSRVFIIYLLNQVCAHLDKLENSAMFMFFVVFFFSPFHTICRVHCLTGHSMCTYKPVCQTEL